MMAPNKTKFRLSRIVASAAVFISLCVPTSTEEIRRCYWCGPLAEQVHRSQRALPCATGAPTQDTVCDPGYPYCAVVATSPPYVESRYCVKLYQDECYLLYCNSTRTWRMTCPCRGDLCNGPNTEREEDAFAGLAKVVAKTQNTRIRRTLSVSSSGFISMNTNRKNRIDNTTIEENKIQGNDTIVIINNEENYINVNETQLDNVNDTKDMDDNNIEIKKMATNVNGNKSEKTSLPEDFKIEHQTITPIENQVNETSIQIDLPRVNAESDDLKTEIILMSSESTKPMNAIESSDIITNVSQNTQITTPENMKEIEVKAMAETTTALTVEKINDNTVKPSEQLPTAGALLHNETPADKITQETTMSTTKSTTVMSIQYNEATTEKSKPQNNTAVRIDAHIVTLFIGVIFVH